ncbi:glycine/betaine ABC transporter [Melittangium boletus DSM 14713]|uniref:Glycine/betaine ABC transporter n=2 Tax=Melittangium boletus TaxID=83453 RepID=A0A250I7M3_9BACT|nr:glycine/betaine ABC transporter [Melittangium boletus DSM 14713]
MNAMNRTTPALLLALTASVLLGTGCKKEQPAEAPAEAKAPAKGTVKLVYVNWAEGVAMTHLAKAILEDRMGYQVELTMADVAPVFTALAGGDSDAFLDAWLPLTHKEYMERFQGKVEDLGTNYEGARIGLVVPSYVKASSISDLQAMKGELDGQIVGIDSGAGIMSTTEKALEAYKLDIKLMTSSGPAMAATLQDAIKRERPVVVTGWKPHWKFARWDLKFLDDPKGVYGGAESIHTLTRLGLEKDKPEVAAFLRSFKLDDQQLGGLMGAVADTKGDPSQAVREWMKQNAALVDGWLPKS